MVSFKNWLPFAVAITFLCGLIYGVSQQILRQDAYDPGVQMAEDWANQIGQSTPVTSLSLGTPIDPAKSLAPFGIVYKSDGTIASSSVTAPTDMMQPDGVFQAVELAPNNETRHTWQPASGARFATVIKKAVTSDNTTYYVLAGRNMREVEDRTWHIGVLTFIGWLITLAAVFVTQHLHLVKHVTGRLRGRRKS